MLFLRNSFESAREDLDRDAVEIRRASQTEVILNYLIIADELPEGQMPDDSELEKVFEEIKGRVSWNIYDSFQELIERDYAQNSSDQSDLEETLASIVGSSHEQELRLSLFRLAMIYQTQQFMERVSQPGGNEFDPQD